jgi:polyvinyl alcohol dehydrogenase (cytochrome)
MILVRLLVALLFVLAAAAQEGGAIYKKHCSACHDQGAGRAPRPEVLKQMSPEGVKNALTEGAMALQGIALSTAEIRSVSEFVTGKPFGSEEASKGACIDPAPPFDQPFARPHWNGWGAGADNHRSQTSAMAGLTPDQISRLKLKWAFGFPGAIRAFAQPTVVGGRVFVGSSGRNVYSLDAARGCVYWAFAADAGVRSSAALAALTNDGPHTSAIRERAPMPWMR